MANLDYLVFDSKPVQTGLPVAQLVTGVASYTQMTISNFAQLSGVDILRVLFHIPKEEILPLINQDETRANKYTLVAYSLFQEKHKNDIHSLSSKITRDHSLGLDVLKKQIFDGITPQEYADQHNRSAFLISQMCINAQVFLSKHWADFRECLMTVSDPYYNKQLRSSEQF